MFMTFFLLLACKLLSVYHEYSSVQDCIHAQEFGSLDSTSFLSSSTPWHCPPQEEEISLKMVFHVENHEIIVVASVKFLVAYEA